MRALASSALAVAVVLLAPAALQSQATLDSATLAAFRWRPVGPANMAGRITDIEGIPGPSKTFYVAAAAGGIWKTTNNGVTFRPIFDHERVISMGDLAIAPSDTNVVYAGTGEEDSRNSISPGGGIYKTTDGGRTWKLSGLVETQAIGRIVVHPRDPNTVYVAALGHIWNANRERGLYTSTDGGATWQLSKFISDKAGFVDVAMDPSDPNTLYAASWERVRGPYFLKSGGPGSALWKTTDAGKTWTEIKGGGFPETMKGRIGLAIAPSNPKIIYAMVEADTVMGAPKGGKRQVRPSGLYRSTDAGVTWTKMNSANVRPFYYSQVRVDTKNPDRVYFSSTPVLFSDDGGKTARAATVGIHVDHHAQWIDPNDPEHFIVGNDGGIGITWDRGGNYDFVNTIPLGQFYAISFDMAVPYRVCGGLQDNGSWCGPSRRRNGAITNQFWFNVGGGDGFYTAQDPVEPDIIYVESQGGNMSRLNYATGERTTLSRPSWRNRYRQFEDSIIITRGDTTRPESPAITRRLAELRQRARADSIDFDIRFNWQTPFFLSPHSRTTFYAAGNRVLKSTNRGENLIPISPDLSTKDSMRIRISTRTTGGITPDVTGAEAHGTVTALAESPIRPGLLYAGTDDGNVWLTRNDGSTWENLTGRFPGVPAKTWVNRIEPSQFDSSTFYIAFDNHRENDFAPYLYVTTDFGRTFRSIANDLPRGGPDFIHVIREDPHNRDLLFVGTDVGVYMSLNRGASWQKFMTGLPTVPVHDLKIHPRDRELIAGTHGRSIWIVDIAPLEQMRGDVVAKMPYLFAPKTAYAYGESPAGGGAPGHKIFQAPSPQYGAEITYRLASNAPRRTRIVITDVSGDTIRTLNGPGGAGVHRAVWDFRGKAPKAEPLSPAGLRDSVVTARKVQTIFDSLEKSGVSRRELDRVRRQLASGGGFGGGGGGGGGFGEGPIARLGIFVERPGEAPPPRAARRPTGDSARAADRPTSERAGAAADDEAAEADPEVMSQVTDVLRAADLFGRGRNPFAPRTGQAPFVASGDYLVSINVGGQTLRQVLRVERIGSNGTTTIANEEDGSP
jgi:photosystem II stability/assembly factor-like uncharacterized protein